MPFQKNEHAFRLVRRTVRMPPTSASFGGPALLLIAAFCPGL
jgi:hypothetical protein